MNLWCDLEPPLGETDHLNIKRENPISEVLMQPGRPKRRHLHFYIGTKWLGI
jgi:hypothetical protein